MSGSAGSCPVPFSHYNTAEEIKIAAGIITTGTKADMVEKDVMDRIYAQHGVTVRGNVSLQWRISSMIPRPARGILRNVKNITDTVAKGETIAALPREGQNKTIAGAN